MQVLDLKAEPDQRGGGILLTWTNPPDAAGVKILRRESTYPVVPDDFGSDFEIYDRAAQPGDSGRFLDTGREGSLKGETVYYYAVIVRDSTASYFPSFTSAMATSPFLTGSYLYKNLPGIYRTFDTATPPATAQVAPSDRAKGQLQRLLEMFGLEFDLIRSFAAGARSFSDTRRIDANLLPLLGQWIGWPTDFTLPVSKQRNEMQYASHFYRTTGVAADLRAMINRVSTWDARIKEFAHNVFRASKPEQLTIAEMLRVGGAWQTAASTTLDVAHEGRVSTLLARDGRPWIFYHARESVPGNDGRPAIRSQLWYKIFEQDDPLPAHRLTSGDHIHRSPAAVQRADGSIWLFSAGYEPAGGNLAVAGLELQVIAAGRGALPARVQGSTAAPFAFSDGDQFQIVLTTGPTITRTVTLRAEDFANINQASAEDLSTVLDRELPGVKVRAANNRVGFESEATGAGVSLRILASTVATALGIAAPMTAIGSDAQAAQLAGANPEPFALTDNSTLKILRNGDIPRTVAFAAASFKDISKATAEEVSGAINAVVPKAAAASAGRVILSSSGAGEPALISVDVSASSAAAILGFGVPPPPSPGPLTQPFALASGDQLVFWGNPHLARRVTFQTSDFADISAATAAEVAAAVNAVVAGAATSAQGQVHLAPWATVDLAGSSAAAELGLAGSSLVEPFALSSGDVLIVSGAPGFTRTVIFSPGSFANISAASAGEVAAAINAQLPGAAVASAGQVQPSPLLTIDATASSAGPKLGLAKVDEVEPTVFEDTSRRLWLFWSSRRSGTWKIWFSRLDGNLWGTPKQLTTGPLPDREPSVLFDPAPGRIWVFWSRKKDNSLWNVFFRRTTKLDFNALVDGDWTQDELTPAPPNPPAGYDNREPMPLLLAADSLELYFSSDRSNGWNIWSKPVSSAAQGADVQVTAGQFTQRAPAPLKMDATQVRLWFRTNVTRVCTSRLYPSAQTVDARYSGSVTADTRNPARLSLRQKIQDIQHYTYHAAVHAPNLSPEQIAQLEEKRLYSRDTVGIYLVPDTSDEELIVRNRTLIADVLRKFLPIQVRAVFLIDQAFSEAVYGYDAASAPLIDERVIDTILSEGMAPITDSLADTAGFRFIRTWAAGTPSGVMPDLTLHPPDMSFRLPIAGVGEEH